MSVMSDWVVTLAQSVQRWCVTLIRRNRDRKAVSKRGRGLRAMRSKKRDRMSSEKKSDTGGRDTKIKKHKK